MFVGVYKGVEREVMTERFLGLIEYKPKVRLNLEKALILFFN